MVEGEEAEGVAAGYGWVKSDLWDLIDLARGWPVGGAEEAAAVRRPLRREHAGRREPDQFGDEMAPAVLQRLRIDVDGIARTELSDEMTIPLGRGHRAALRTSRTGLVLGPLATASGDGRSRELASSRAVQGEESLVDQRGRYSNLPISRLHALRKLAHGNFAKRIRELHERLHDDQEGRVRR